MRWILPCLAAMLVFAAIAGGAGSGIRGRVTASPTCPVERYPPDPQCAPRGFAARVRIRRASDRHVVKTVVTRGDGRFSVTIGAGRYLVGARPASGASLPACPQAKAVRVTSGRMTAVGIACDSGIR